MQKSSTKRRNAALAPVSVMQPLEDRKMFSQTALDTSFGGSGRVTSQFGSEAVFESVVTLPDGKVLAAGTVANGSKKHDFLVARYNVNGSLDTSFGSGTGRVYTDFGNGEDHGAAVVLLANGKFAVVGRSTPTNESTEAGFAALNFAVARYNANGSLDTSFSSDGKTTIDFAGQGDRATAAAVLSDGKLLVVGVAGSSNLESPGADIGAARLNVNGSLDTSFNGTGKIKVNFGKVTGAIGGGTFVYGQQYASTVAVLPTGGFLVGGSIDDFYDSGLDFRDFMLAKFTSAGKLDTSFGGGKGWLQSHPDTGINDANAMAVLSSGKILLGGTSSSFGGGTFESKFTLQRFNSNGSLDTSFASGGTSFADFSTSDDDVTDDQIRGLSVQPNGKILAVGTYVPDSGGTRRTAVARFNSNGFLDSSFSGDGKLLTSAINGGHAVAAAPGGKTVVVGNLGSAAGVFRLGSDFAATASISGTFFNDLDGDGVRDANEGPLVGWQAFVDSNNDGFYTPGEAIASTNSSGKYTITGLIPGTYRVREIRLDGWNRTKPGGAYPLGYYDVTLGTGSVITGRDFGNKHV